MANTLKGIEVKTAILDDETVRELRRARCAGATYAALARRFPVSKTQAFRIVHGECWAHVSGEAVEGEVPRDELVGRIGGDSGHLRRQESRRAGLRRRAVGAV